MNKQELKKLEKKVLENFKDLLNHNGKVVIGVSGGADSIFLTHLLHKAGYTLIVAHLNHCLRGKESDKDQKFVTNFCKKLQITCETKSENIAELSSKNGVGTEEAGRKTRYSFFLEICKKHKTNQLVTGHHSDDNIETVLMNLARGSGLKGISGMKEKEIISKVELIRPILNINKTQIEAYLKANNIPFREDKSNKDQKYTRNFIRHTLIPTFSKINPNFNTTLSKNIINFKEANDFIEQNAKKWIKENYKKNHLNRKKLLLEPIILQKQIIFHLYKLEIGETQNLENKHIDEVLTLINRNIGNKEKKLGKLLIKLKNNSICLEKITKKVHY